MTEKQELIEFIRDNLTITIERNPGYYSYPSLEVRLFFAGELVSSDSETIYDGDRNE